MSSALVDWRTLSYQVCEAGIRWYRLGPCFLCPKNERAERFLYYGSWAGGLKRAMWKEGGMRHPR